MISDRFKTETAEMLSGLGYQADFLENVQNGDEIAMMHKEWTGGEELDLVEFFTVLPEVRRTRLLGEDGPLDSYSIRLILRMESGATRPYSANGSWGIYIKRDAS